MYDPWQPGCYDCYFHSIIEYGYTNVLGVFPNISVYIPKWEITRISHAILDLSLATMLSRASISDKLP